MSSVRGLQLILAFVVAFAAGKMHAASVVGDNVEIWTVAQSSGAEFLQDTVLVVDPGIEYTSKIINTEIYNLNVGPASILLETLSDWYSPWFDSGFPPTTLEVRDIDVPGMPELSIGGVAVIFSDTIVPEPGAPLGYPAFSEANVTFTAGSVILHTGPYSFPTGSRVQIDLSFVPEPDTIGLSLCGLFLAAVFGRRLQFARQGPARVRAEV